MGVMGNMPSRYVEVTDELMSLLNTSDIAVSAVRESSDEDVLTSVRFNDDLMDVDMDEEEEPEKPKLDPVKTKGYLLPARWDPTNTSLIMSGDGLDLKLDHRSGVTKTYDIKCIKADSFIPLQCGIFYYEIKITQVTNNNLDRSCDVSVGFMTAAMNVVSKSPGLEIGTFGFNGSDGHIYANQSMNDKYNKKFGMGDVIGCGVNFIDKTIFYTKNGVNLGVAFKDVKTSLYPVIGLKDGNGVVTNFGQSEFIYNIEGYVHKQKNQTLSTIFNDVSTTVGSQDLVASYFDHLGYVDVSKTFRQELNKELNHDDILVDDQSLQTRQQIRNYLLNGEIDSAIKLTNLQFPRVFNSNETILFQLQCYKFIQLIKRHEVDDAIQFGQSLKSNDTKCQDFLNDIFSLLAYEDPEKSEFGYLLNDAELLKISDELNSEILKSLGKERVSTLQKKIEYGNKLLQLLNDNDQLDSLLLTNSDLGI
jgi:hypothetical protein